MKPRLRIVLIFLVFFLGCLLLQLAYNPFFNPLLRADYWRTVGKIGEVLRIVHVSHVDEENATFEELSDEALAGMLQSLDRYSNYLPAEQYEEYRRSSRMEYVGIGVEVNEIEERVTIVQVFEGGSAQKAGFLPGDRIIAVDEEDTSGLNLRQVIQRIKGPPGTPVTIRVERPLPKGELKFKVMRRSLMIPAVSNVQVMEKRVGYLHINRFTEETATLLRESLDFLKQEGVQFLVLDLRGNPGGLLTSSVEVASEFLEDGQLVVGVRGRDEKKSEELVALVDGRKWEAPIAVLMDQASASASEILAGALKTHGLAKVIGVASVGKGTVQTVYDLKGDAGMILTTAKYYLPDGTTIAGKGILPDKEVTISGSDWSLIRLSLLHRSTFDSREIFEKTFGFKPMEDPQLEAALQSLGKHELPVAEVEDVGTSQEQGP